MVAIPPTDSLLTALRVHFGHADFRAGQREVVEAVLAGNDAVVVMPTGGGKSLCYQLPAILSRGTTLVISPLIALMKDQIDALRSRGIAAAALNSQIDTVDQMAVQRSYREGSLHLLYVAPERLVRPDFRSLLAQTPPSRIVVDEAHCISEWGHDFRRDYLRIGEVSRELGPIQVVACTATATPEVRADIAARLQLRDPHVVVHGFARPNLQFSVERLRNEVEKLSRLDELLDPGDGHAIVYAGTRARARDLAERIAARFPTMLYHGDMPHEVRIRAQERFVAGDVRVAVTTSAFGMGVDVPTVRQVIHVALPASLEEYYQQAGRAGRDGGTAQCVLLHAPADRRLQEFFIEAAHPNPSTLEGVRRSLRDMGGDPGAWSLVTTRHDSVRSLSDAAGDTAREILREHGAADGRGSAAGNGLAGIDHARIATHRRSAYRRFEALTLYLSRPVCRHRQIMEYFGESGAPESCGGGCDVCSRAPSVERRLEHELVRSALGLVAHLNGRVGMGKLAGILVGSRSRAVLAVHGVTELPEYGMFQGWREADVQELLHRLLEAGALRQTSPPYPAVALTVDGVAILRGDRSIDVDDPRAPERNRPAAPRAAAATPVSVEEAARFEKLRAWRAERSREKVVPAYIVLPDRTLVELAARMPRSEAELLAVAGIGPTKLALYGQDLLRLLGEMRDGEMVAM